MRIINYMDNIMKTGLFGNFSEDELELVFNKVEYNIKKYSKNSLIFIEDEECNALNIILQGKVIIRKIDSFGKSMIIAEFKEGDTIGETLLFGVPNRYPMSVVSSTETIILFIPKKAVLHLCKSDEVFLERFLKFISEKSITLSGKLDQISLKTIQQKICEFIMLDYKKNNRLKIKLNMTKKQWADIMGVQRPSLSRELLRLKQMGILDYDYKYIYIKDLVRIKDIVMSS